MHGLGNDFVVIDAISQTVTLSCEQIRYLADRHRGIGCDQLLLVEASQHPDIDFRYRIFNADGSEVEQCGNGARCFARFVSERGLTNKSTILVETHSGVITLYLVEGNKVKVNMGKPQFSPASLPFNPVTPAIGNSYYLELDGKKLVFTPVSMGNPHIVIHVADINTTPIAQWGGWLESHAAFPQRVNVGFMQVIDRQHIQLRVFERGAGETQACGTGACAAAVAGIEQGLLDTMVEVQLSGGKLDIMWQGKEVYMIGSASFVFDGYITL